MDYSKSQKNSKLKSRPNKSIKQHIMMKNY